LNYSQLKSELTQQITAQLQHQIRNMLELIAAAEGDRNSEEKSSVGDKYETSREMIQQEVNKYNQLLSRYQRELHLVQNVQISAKACVELGSLVVCSNAIYFLLVPMGKITLGKYEVFVVSPASPVGLALMHKSVSNTFQLNGKTDKILQIC
jgi:transcription elongation GreA/GreB family factor